MWKILNKEGIVMGILLKKDLDKDKNLDVIEFMEKNQNKYFCLAETTDPEERGFLSRENKVLTTNGSIDNLYARVPPKWLDE